ncbi:MAG: hypothetical protein WBC78_07675 [Candidatus Sulfotelmatobacter sp.]
MSRTPSRRPVRTTLSETLDHRLKMYSIAAAAAGVSVLALAQPADAEVEITWANIPVNTGASIAIDINHDGIPDFQFSLPQRTYTGLPPFSHGVPLSSTLKVAPLTGGAVFLGPKPAGYYAAALQRLARIGPLGHFSTKGGGVAIEHDNVEYVYVGSGAFGTYRTYRGNWVAELPNRSLPNRYLGVKFLIDGQTHYGWVRLKVTSGDSDTGIGAEILAYAYETEPDKPIVARIPQDLPDDTEAEPEIKQESQSFGGPSLGILALGADALSLWRRDETLTF